MARQRYIVRLMKLYEQKPVEYNRDISRVESRGNNRALPVEGVKYTKMKQLYSCIYASFFDLLWSRSWILPDEWN